MKSKEAPLEKFLYQINYIDYSWKKKMILHYIVFSINLDLLAKREEVHFFVLGDAKRIFGSIQFHTYVLPDHFHIIDTYTLIIPPIRQDLLHEFYLY